MAKIRVFEGVTNDTVALTMGFGHTAFGEFNDGKGMDVMALVTPSSEPGSGLSVWNDTRIRNHVRSERIRHQMDDGRRS